MRWVIVGIVLGGCSFPGVPELADYEQASIELETISPPIALSGMPVYAAVGDVVLGTQLTKDGGTTWATPKDLISLETARAITPLEFVVDTTQFGLSRWNMEADFVQGISQPFPHATFGASPTTGSIVIASGTTAMVARHDRDFAWSPSTLTMPGGATEPAPVPSAIVSNGSTFVMTTRWGVYRSVDDGVTWTSSAPARYDQALALDDKRFLVIAADRTGAVLDATGQATGTITPAFRTGPTGPKVACLGAVLDGSEITRDLGMTWSPLFPSTAGAFEVRSASCAGDALIVSIGRANQPAPTYTVRISALGSYGTVLPVATNGTATDLRRSARGTFFSTDQAWSSGSTAWAFRPLPAVTHLLANGDLLALTTTDVLRSTDDGATWQATPREAFSAALELTSVVGEATLYGIADGKLHRSTDGGVRWTEVGPTPAGLALVEVTPEGALIGRVGDTAVHVSEDDGHTWRGEAFPRNFRLAGITHAGVGVTFEIADEYPKREIYEVHAWHLWDDYGLGLAFKQLMPRMGGSDVRIGAAGKVVAFDTDDVMYFTGGGVAVISRTTTPLR